MKVKPAFKLPPALPFYKASIISSLESVPFIVPSQIDTLVKQPASSVLSGATAMIIIVT